MLFNSYIFIFAFLPVTFFVYFFLTGSRLFVAAKAWLVLASLFFYSWWNIAYLPLLLLSIIVNFAIGRSLSEDHWGKRRITRKQLLIAGIVFNVGLLGYFKYAGFFVENLNYVAGTEFLVPHIVLPLAISFYTFQKIAYLVDSYRYETKEYDFLGFALFVTFFPQLIAGPIVHHKEMMPQFDNRFNLVKRYKNIALGLFIFGIGLFKKVMIADSLAVWANAGFETEQTLTFFAAWATSLSYTFQLYFDFSGYTDMAIGAALLFNIRLPINFNSPYKAANIRDFWQRWHITLSRFLRDYLYIPLGGNRYGLPRTCANLFTTFLIGGIWHGASWMFLIWGAMHGGALVLHRLWTAAGMRMPVWLGWVGTFLFINATWIFFRAENMGQATKVLLGMSGWNGVVIHERLAVPLAFLQDFGISFGTMFATIHGDTFGTPILLITALLICLFARNSMEWAAKLETIKTLRWDYALVGIMAGIALVAVGQATNSEFLYFNF